MLTQEYIYYCSDAKSQPYYVKTFTPNGYSHVYCHMESIPGCGEGGWTLVMKIDGYSVSEKNLTYGKEMCVCVYVVMGGRGSEFGWLTFLQLYNYYLDEIQCSEKRTLISTAVQ